MGDAGTSVRLIPKFESCEVPEKMATGSVSRKLMQEAALLSSMSDPSVFSELSSSALPC